MKAWYEQAQFLHGERVHVKDTCPECGVAAEGLIVGVGIWFDGCTPRVTYEVQTATHGSLYVMENLLETSTAVRQ